MSVHTSVEAPRPCPFCGAGLKSTELSRVGYKNTRYFVLCSNCQAQGPHASNGEEAVSRWNTSVKVGTVSKEK